MNIKFEFSVKIDVVTIDVERASKGVGEVDER